MKKDKTKIKEPFEPKDTPKPPQIIEPDSGRKRENPVQDQNRNTTEYPDQNTSDKKKEKSGRSHLLGDEADIDDETTL